MLSCPKCGGDVAATNHACEYCGVQLKVKACPRCFARIFHGSKHCDQCGAESVVPAAANPDGTAMRRHCARCPDESSLLVARLVEGVLLDECPNCHGVFVDVVVLERVLKDREPLESILVAGVTKPARPEPLNNNPAGRMYIPCPDCRAMMNRVNFGRSSGVIVDVCKDHGTWFDADELPRVVKFVLDGGLEKAQHREMEDLKAAAKRAAAEARAAKASSNSVAMGSYHSPGALGGLLKAIHTVWVK